MNWSIIRQWAVLLALAVVTSLYVVDCWDERRAEQEAAEQAILDAEQAERNLHVAIAARSRNYTFLENMISSSDSVKALATKEMNEWLDSLAKGE